MLSTKEEQDSIRKCVVFYSVLGNADKPDLLKQDLNIIRKMPFQALKTQLLPMLHTKLGRFDKDLLFDVAINYLENLMKLEDIETEFVERFFQGDFRPEFVLNYCLMNQLQTA